MDEYKDSIQKDNTGLLDEKKSLQTVITPAHTKETHKNLQTLFQQCKEAMTSAQPEDKINQFLQELLLFCHLNFCQKYTIIKFEPICNALNHFLDYPNFQVVATTLEIVSLFIEFYSNECVELLGSHPIKVLFDLLANPEITFELSCDVLKSLIQVCKCGNSNDNLDLDIFHYPISELPEYAYLSIKVIGAILNSEWGFEQDPPDVLRFINVCFICGRNSENFDTSDVCDVFRCFILKYETYLPDVWATGIPENLLESALTSDNIIHISSACTMVIQALRSITPETPKGIANSILNSISINELFSFVLEGGLLLMCSFTIISLILRKDNSFYSEIAARASAYALAIFADSDIHIKAKALDVLAAIAEAAPTPDLPQLAKAAIEIVCDIADIPYAKSFVKACSRSVEARQIIAETVEERLDDGTDGLMEIAEIIGLEC